MSTIDERKALSPSHVRRLILEQSRRAHVGHIGSALSIVEILAALYSGTLRGAGPGDPGRDRLILSKGHAALALYAVLHLRGWLSAEQLDGYCADGSLLGVHPESALEGIDVSTGSLGQGLCVGLGTALAARLARKPWRVFVLLSDAECNEGSLWEAVMFAAHHHMANLVAIVDVNGQQAFGHTRDVLDLTPLSSRWRAFGWDVHEVDGHDVGALHRTLDGLDTALGPPHVLIAQTVFGKGVSFMESQIKWHYLPVSDEEYGRAMREIGPADEPAP